MNFTIKVHIRGQYEADIDLPGVLRDLADTIEQAPDALPQQYNTNVYNEDDAVMATILVITN